MIKFKVQNDQAVKLQEQIKNNSGTVRKWIEIGMFAAGTSI